MDNSRTDRTDRNDNLLCGPEFDAVVDAVCREAETDAAIDEPVVL